MGHFQTASRFSSSHDGRGRGRAVVGVMCCNRALDGRTIQSIATRFVAPLARYANVCVMLVPALADAIDAARFAALFDGLLLTGSCSNVDPVRYGGSPLPQGQEIDRERDQVALCLAARMIEAGKPVFGICRGLQELNVLFGGTLSPDVGERHFRSAGCFADADFDHWHDIEIVGDGPLADRFGRRRMQVNSVHHQGIARLGAGLSVEAQALDDGLVEAIWAEPCGAPVVGVQWHPEWDVATNADSRHFFQLLGQAVTAAER